MSAEKNSTDQLETFVPSFDYDEVNSDDEHVSDNWSQKHALISKTEQLSNPFYTDLKENHSNSSTSQAPSCPNFDTVEGFEPRKSEVTENSPSIITASFQVQYSPTLIFIVSYFVTIATILGTGILGLPVKLTYSGFVPFTVTFTACVFMQCMLVYYFTEILQRVTLFQNHYSYRTVANSDEIALEVKPETSASLPPQLDEPQQPSSHPAIDQDQRPNLHLLSELLLDGSLSQCVFLLSVFLHFVSVLTSYLLAGSEAYGHLLGIDYVQIIPVYFLLFTAAILFCKNFIEPLISILTFFKGTFLIVTVAVTAYVGRIVSIESQTDWLHIGDSYLLGTVALGGVVNVMPMIFTHVPMRYYEVLVFRRAVLCGALTCFFLNVLWCFSVLDVVPQCNPHRMEISPLNPINCSISLSHSAENGEIATVPLTDIIVRDHNEFHWISVLTSCFITLSVTVSYLTMGSAFRHTLQGSIHSLAKYFTLASSPQSSFPKNLSQKSNFNRTICLKTFVYSLSFGCIFVCATFQPKGFFQVLEKATSMALNLESGVFIVIMLRNCSSIRFQHLPEVPLPLPPWIHQLHIFVMAYFLFAVFYDVIVTVLSIFIHSEYLN